MKDSISQPIPEKQPFCPKALTEDCFCSANTLPYKRKKKITLKFGHLSLVDFSFGSQKEVTETDHPQACEKRRSYSGCPATAAKNPRLHQSPSVSVSASQEVPFAATREGLAESSAKPKAGFFSQFCGLWTSPIPGLCTEEASGCGQDTSDVSGALEDTPVLVHGSPLTRNGEHPRGPAGASFFAGGVEGAERCPRLLAT